MKLRVKSFHSHEIEDGLEFYQPEDPDNFGTWIRVEIGSTESNGSDDFTLLVCTPAWLATRVNEDADFAWWGRHTLIVARYDSGQMKATIERRGSRFSGG
jgi:hypothetical protein